MTLNEYIKSKKDIKLSGSQSEAINKISDFLTSDTPCFILKGFAGTGKTFITAQIAQYLDSIDCGIKVLTPTGRSAKVAGDKLALVPKFDKYGKVDHIAKTIHRGIYKSIATKDEDGYSKRIFVLKENEERDRSVYFIDEASMLSDKENMEDVEFGSGKLLKDLIDYVAFVDGKVDIKRIGTERKMIFVGDSAQLTPVDMSYSPALSAKYLKEKYGLDSNECELTDVFRQDSSSGILSNATRLREDISEKQYYDLNFNINGYNDIEEIDSSSSIDKYIDIHNHDNLDNNIFITYSTSNAKKYNKEIRTKLFEIDHLKQELVNNERLICIENNYKYDIFNGEFLTIKRLIDDVEKRTVHIRPGRPADKEFYKDVIVEKLGAPIELQWQKAEIEYYNHVGEKVTKEAMLNMTILCTDDRSMTQIQRQALFVDLLQRTPGNNKEEKMKNIDYGDPFFSALVIKYGYAVVGHKAQGGEWNKVMIDFDTMIGKNCEEYFRWCYTVTTRAKEKNYLINIPREAHDPDQREKMDKYDDFIKNL